MSDSHGKALSVVQLPTNVAMSPVVAAGLAIMERNPDAATLRELLAVQKEWEANEARKAYAVAMVAMKRDLPAVVSHDKTVSYATRGSDKATSYTHSSLAHVLDAVMPALNQHGFSLSWHPANSGDRGVGTTCRLTHERGHVEEVTLFAPPDASGGKNTVQAIGSTITYLQRYTACSLLGIATKDMKEPHGDADGKPSDPDRVESKLNLKVVGWLLKQGRSREQAEAFVGREVPDWTADDLERLKTWAKPADTKETE